nr:NTP transferase domain-containing protein [Cytophagales bacterium]
MNLQPISNQPIRTALLLLAAGNSSRMGQPKQLLQLNNSTLLQHTLKETLAVPFFARVLVLGAFQEEIKAHPIPPEVEVLQHPEWNLGMGSSICTGMKWLVKNHAPDQVLILICDQPFIHAALLEQLISKKASSAKGVVASAYGDTFGVPVLFDKSYFPHLLAMEGKVGAQKLLSRFKEDVETVPFPKGNIDIDTPDDYDAYLREDWGYFDLKK